VAHVTVVELEPTIVRWFREYGEGRAERAAAGERAGRARIECADVTAVLARDAGRYDLVTLDTDNGPAWLVRDDNAGLYAEAGVRLAAAALRPGGVAVFWSPDRYREFEDVLARVFPRVVPEAAFDVVQGRRHEYTMYVGLPEAR
jgi:spermidine synthase